MPWSDAPIVPDIGFLADSLLSSNHESGADKFQGLRSYIDGTIQLRYGEEIGMGSRDYELIVL